MVSREFTVHIVAVVLGFAAVAIGLHLQDVVGVDSRLALLSIGVLFYLIVHGGAHFYLALKNDRNGIVTVRARWRFLAVLSILGIVVPIRILLPDTAWVPPIATHLSTLLIGAVVLWYLVAETRDAYRVTVADD